MTHPSLLASATEIAARIRTQAWRSRDVVAAHVARIRAVNPRLNAVVAERFDAALAEAEAVDRRVAARPASTLPPLLGVPCTIKECFEVEGMPQTAGLVARRGVVGQQDCVTVARLRAAGAVVIGVTNLSELCMWYESHNLVYGRCNNAYDPRRIPGGSSGGEGAVVGAGGSPFGLGADFAGSIRMPAFFNGVFGHKPTGGLVPVAGHYPQPHGAARRYCTVGPLARRAEDLMPLLRVLAGPDGDPTGLDLPLHDDRAVDVGQLRVFDVADDGTGPVDPRLRQAQQRCLEHLRARGAQVEPLHLAELRHTFDIWSAMCAAAGGPSYSELLGNGREVSAPRELVRFLAGRSPYTLPSLALAAIEKLPKWLPARSRRFEAMGAALGQRLAALFDGRTVLLYPSHPRPAPRHREPLVRPFGFRYNAFANVLELPATQVPLGLAPGRLPLGVQVVAGRGEDHLTIAVAGELERAFGGWVAGE